MTKCPHCKEEINDLLAYSSIVQTMELENGEAEFYGMDYCEDWDFFDCPECNERIAESKEVATKFLRGEK